jgi:hypothetical protein
MKFLDLVKLDRTPLATDPYEFVVVPGFLPPAGLERIRKGYPKIDRPGSFPVSDVAYDAAFREFLGELEGAEFRHAIEAKFGLDLSEKPTIVTVRGQCSARDGGIHTDSKSKLVTVLIYLNDPWEADGGRLRLLRSPDDLENYALELPPDAGLLLAFRRGARSFHGHKPFQGPRRVIQLNWVAHRGHVYWDLMRHRLSALFKRAA